MMKANQHKGQVALVLVLIMTVVSSLAVSLASRSTVDSRIQQTESEGVKALLFAQTGVEQMLLNPAGTSLNESNYEVTKVDSGSDIYTVGRVAAGSSVELNLSGANFTSLTGLRVYWSPDIDNAGAQPAILVSRISTTGVVSDYAYDYTGTNGFVAASDGSAQGYDRVTPTVPLTSTISKVRIMVLGASSLLRVVPVGAGATFPSQVVSIRSVGKLQTEVDTVKYGLQLDESTSDSVPVVFDYVLFSGGSIVQ